MKATFNRTLSILHLLMVAAMLLTSFIVTRGFFNDLVTAKQYGLEIACLGAVLLLAVVYLTRRAITFTGVDLAIALFACWYIASELLAGAHFIPLKKLFFNISLWGFVYLFARQLGGSHLLTWGVAISWLVISLLQSGLGLLQLHGFENSWHALFSITGTFHNPGPYSGFVVSGLPLALCVVLIVSGCRGDVSPTPGNCLTPANRVSFYRKWLTGRLSMLANPLFLILVLAWATIIALMLVLPPGGSRGAWVAGIGQHVKARQVAMEIVETPARVESTATREITSEMRLLLSNKNEP